MSLCEVRAILGLKSAQEVLKVPIIKMLQRVVGAGKAIWGSATTATAPLSTPA